MVLAIIDVFCEITTLMLNKLIQNNLFAFSPQGSVDCKICIHKKKKGKVL